MWNPISREIHLRTLLYFNGIRIFPHKSKAPHSFNKAGPTKCSCVCSGTRGIKRDSPGEADLLFSWHSQQRLSVTTYWKKSTLGYSRKCSHGHSFEPAMFTFSMLAAHFRHVQVQGVGTNIFLYAVSFLFVSWKLVITWVILKGGTQTHWKWALDSSCPCLRLNDTGNRTAIWLAKQNNKITNSCIIKYINIFQMGYIPPFNVGKLFYNIIIYINVFYSSAPPWH